MYDIPKITDAERFIFLSERLNEDLHEISLLTMQIKNTQIDKNIDLAKLNIILDKGIEIILYLKSEINYFDKSPDIKLMIEKTLKSVEELHNSMVKLGNLKSKD